MAVERLRFRGTDSGNFYIDIAQALSLQRRSLHRQKKVYTIYGGYYVDSNGSRINMNTAPNTWPMKRAVNRAFKIWRKMIATTLSKSEGMTSGKWNDFKIFMNTAGSSNYLLPLDSNNGNLYDGSIEWDYSTLTTEDPDSDGAMGTPDAFELMLVGPHASAGSGNDKNYSRVSVIQSWIDTRATVSAEPLNTPNQPDGPTDPLANLFDSGDVDDDRLIVIEAEGDLPPYDVDHVFGNASISGSGNLQRQSVAITNSNVPVHQVHGFHALCGLVQVVVEGDPGAWELVLDVESQGESF